MLLTGQPTTNSDRNMLKKKITGMERNLPEQQGGNRWMVELAMLPICQPLAET